MTDCLPDLHFNGDSQCFPLYLYEKEEPKGGLFHQLQENASAKLKRKDAITDKVLEHFQSAYPNGKKITKETLFYYIYGILHAQDYRQTYGVSLSKQLPRIPRVKREKDFWIFSEIGRKLADIHLNYEEVTPYFNLDDHDNISILTGEISEEDLFHVDKMAFIKKKNKEGKLVPDKERLKYNHYITVKNIPLEAYDYKINGKSALEWIIDRYQVKIDKRSGITNDPNSWALEEAKDPKYPLLLFLKIITISIETLNLIKQLPTLDILDD